MLKKLGQGAIILTSVAATRSTLSMPTPARPTTLRRPLEASNTSRVTCVIKQGKIFSKGDHLRNGCSL